MTLRFAVLLFAGAAVVAGCADSHTTKPTASAPTAGVTAAPTAVYADAPMPRHVVFAAGETIAADGEAGIFFLDPRTGAAEGWVVPAATFPGQDPLPFSFTVGGVSADGGRVVYRCLEATASSPVPCGGESKTTWYLLDTKSGARTRLAGFSGSFPNSASGSPLLSLSPDGKTLFGQTRDGVALADVERPDDVRTVALTTGSDLSYASADWSPDSSRLILGTAGGTFLVDVKTSFAKPLKSQSGWSPDSTRTVAWTEISEGVGELSVIDRDGGVLWSKRVASSGPGGGWSPDGRLLYIETQDQPSAGAGYGQLIRVEILDSSTGAAVYRIKGGLCPIGWVGATHRLLTSSYGFGEILVEPVKNAVRLFDAYAIPMPFDDDAAIVFNGADFSSYDLATGETKVIAHTSVTPSWDGLHGFGLFAGDRLVFTALHRGHDGCGVGESPKDPPRPELLVGPFSDDVPVTVGAGQ
jgi:hypothetical protein